MTTHRETVDFGIDLGTTNSAIARAEGADAVIIRNIHQREFTPSAVHVGPSGNVVVGDAARHRVQADPGNAVAEFKIKMGTRGNPEVFKDSGRSMTPEELSAEVLKSLRADVERSNDGEQIQSAVITVPAAFELDQCDATRRAAELAGLRFAPLLQEPTAAAWAYSVHETPAKAFWLVYDFGGGTFDAAVLKVRDGEFTVVNHAGDNSLGGKLADWAVVENLLIPQAQSEYGLTSLTVGNRRSAGNIAKLKGAAENAKIELSQRDAVDVLVDLTGDDGSLIDFHLEITRADVERLTRPLIERSIRLCRNALTERGTKPSDIDRVLLVGGMSQSPLVREMLADSAAGLGIPLDYSLDPVTVVARGAAIFAGTQRIPKSAKAAAAPVQGQVALDLQYAAVGQDLDPLVGGRASAEGRSEWSGYTIEIARGDREWTSGKVPLRADGAFSTRLLAEANTRSTYTITLRDPQGASVATDTPSLSYRNADLIGTAPTLSHSIGVGYADNSMGWLLTKGTELKSSKRIVVHTAVEVKRNAGTGLIRVPIVSGERPRADRNTVIGQLELRPDQVSRDVPAGVEVEVFVEIDTSFRARADAYVPFLDEEFEIDVDLSRSTAPDLATLRAEKGALEDRYDDLKSRASSVDAPEAREILDRFDSQDTLTDIDQLLRQAEVDPDATATCQVRLRDAQTALDEVEELLELPRDIEEAREALSAVKEVVQQSGRAEHRTEMRAIQADLEAAIKDRDHAVIKRRTEDMRTIGIRVLGDTGQLHVIVFSSIEDELSSSPDRQVQRLLSEGRSALASGNLNQLANINARLRPYLPDLGSGTNPENQFSTVTKGRR